MSNSKRSATTADLDSSGTVSVKVDSKKTKKSSSNVKWTAAEDAALVEAAEKLLKAGIWDAVKADKRLSSRGNSSVHTRIAVLLKKMTK